MNEAGAVFFHVKGVPGYPPGQVGTRTAAEPSGAAGYLLPDREPPPWNPEQDLYRRWRRRVRCAADGAEG